MQVLDRVNELLELRYRARGLEYHDDLLDAAVHAVLTRNSTARRPHHLARELVARWDGWDNVRQAPEGHIAEHLLEANLRKHRGQQIRELLQRVHADTTSRGWRGTTLNWLNQEPVPTVSAYLATLPHITEDDARRIARECLNPRELAQDPRASRILTRLGLASAATSRNGAPDAPRTGNGITRAKDGIGVRVPRGVNAETLRQNLIHHSRAVCRPRTPGCGECPLISFCAEGRSSQTGDGRPVAVEAFAGGGGLGEGFRRAGFDVAIAVELDRDAAQTYRLNHPGTVVVEADATSITGEELAFLAPRATRAAAIAAGPPCQGYSAAGRRQADDKRNSLYKAVVELATHLQPRFVVIENVPGMRRVGGQSYVQSVLDALRAAGYNANEHLLRASDYGVPQLRRRMIFLAQRSEAGEAPAAPLPTHCADRKCDHTTGPLGGCALPRVPSVIDTLEADGLPELVSGQVAEFIPVGGGRGPVTNASTMAHSAEVLAKIATITPGGGPISYRRLHPDLARTIVAGHRALPVHPTLHRTISVREAARIQGFSDSHVFAGPRSKQPLQVANAVPPALGRAIAEVLLDVMAVSSAERPGGRDVLTP